MYCTVQSSTNVVTPKGEKTKRKKDEPNRSVLNNIPPDITFINGIRYRNAMK